MAVRDALSTLALAALFAAAIIVNDIVMEHRMVDFLSTHPEIISSAVSQAQSQRADASAARMQQQLTAHWDVLSQTRAYAVRFNGSQFTSRLVRIGDIATPKSLNLLATDYRCGYCRADRAAVDALLRANPNREFVFIEAAILGPDSVELAKAALRRAQSGEADYYVIHNRQFDAPAKSSSEAGDAEVQLLTEQKRFLDIVGVFATPTYIRDGVFRSGTIGVPSG